MLTLSVPHHGGIVLLVVGQAANESVHVKGVQLAVGLLLPSRSAKVLAVRVEEARQAAHKRRPHTVGVEGLGADQRHDAQAPVVGHAIASTALVEAITLRPVVAHRAHRISLRLAPVEAVALHPDRVLCVPHWLDHHVGHDGRGGNGRLRISRGRVASKRRLRVDRDGRYREVLAVPVQERETWPVHHRGMVLIHAERRATPSLLVKVPRSLLPEGLREPRVAPRHRSGRHGREVHRHGRY